jgi:DNA-binding CsgD family transcriptional regulator
MKLDSSHLIIKYPPSLNRSAQIAGEFAARMSMVNELGAAIVHDLKEPFAALLSHLNKIRDEGERSVDTAAGPNWVREIVKRALCETQRVCDIMEFMDHSFRKSADAEIAIVGVGETIDSMRSGIAKRRENVLSTPRHSRHDLLTPRECEVLGQITGGASNKEGGQRLGISTRTFEVHRAHVMEKFKARNAADLVRMALSEI